MQNKILFERQLKNSIKKIIKEILLENEQEETEKRKQALGQLEQNKQMYLTNVNALYDYLTDIKTTGMKRKEELEALDKEGVGPEISKKLGNLLRNLKYLNDFMFSISNGRITDSGFKDIVRGLSNKIEKLDLKDPRALEALESSIKDQMSKLVSQKNYMTNTSKQLAEYGITLQKSDEYFTNIIAALDSAITNLENMSSKGTTRTNIKILPDYYRENKKIRRGRFVK
jgi:cation transport regulator ChaC